MGSRPLTFTCHDCILGRKKDCKKICFLNVCFVRSQDLIPTRHSPQRCNQSFVWVPVQKTWPQHVAKDVVSSKKKKFHWFDWHKNLSGGDDFPHSFNRFDFLSCGKEKYVNLNGSGCKFILLPTTVKPSCIYFSNCTVPQMRLLSWHGHEQPMGDGSFFYVWKSGVKIDMESVIYACVPMCQMFFLAMDNSLIFVSDAYLRSLGGVLCIWLSCCAGLFSEPKTNLQRYIDGCWKSIFSFMFMLFCTVPMCFVGFLVEKLSEKHLTKKKPFFVFVINHKNSRPSVLSQTCRCVPKTVEDEAFWGGGFFLAGGWGVVSVTMTQNVK